MIWRHVRADLQSDRMEYRDLQSRFPQMSALQMLTLATYGLQIRQNKRRHTAPNDVPPLLLSVCYFARRSGFACFHGLVNLGRHLFLEFRVVAEDTLRSFLALTELAAIVAVPRAALFKDAKVDT